MKINNVLILSLMAGIILMGTTHASGFGEIASNDSCQCLNFTMYPNSTMSLTWGIINEFKNRSLNYTEATMLELSSNSPSLHAPSISVDPNALVIAPMTILYANVTVNTTGVAPGTMWDASLLGSTQPLSNATNGIVIRLSTLKKVQIHVLAPAVTTTVAAAVVTNTTTILAGPGSQGLSGYTIGIIVLVIIIVIIAVWLRSRGAKKVS